VGFSTEVWFEELPKAQVTLLLAPLELVRLRRISLGQRMESKDGVWGSPAVAIRLSMRMQLTSGINRTDYPS
jgi:hypothetical protein